MWIEDRQLDYVDRETASVDRELDDPHDLDDSDDLDGSDDLDDSDDPDGSDDPDDPDGLDDLNRGHHPPFAPSKAFPVEI